MDSPHLVILPAHIDELNRIHDAMPAMRLACTRFDHAIRLYESIKSISETSPFRLVGCFSLIELLLVDRGGPKTKQIKSKIPNLCSRSGQVGYRRMPKAHWSKPEFWEDFYDCRSDVAHNGSSLYGQIAKYGLTNLEIAVRELNEVNKFILGACIDDTAFVAGMKS